MKNRHQQRRPLSARVREMGDETLAQEVEAMERIAMAGVSSVAANGKFPHWPVERWLLVVGFAASIVASTFGAGGKWRALTSDVDEMKRNIATISNSLRETDNRVTMQLQGLSSQVQQLQEANDNSNGGNGRPRPAFPDDSRFRARP